MTKSVLALTRQFSELSITIPAAKSPGMSSNCTCFLKVIWLKSEDRNRISQEILMLKNLKHNNIINFINAWINRKKSEVVFVTEMVTGGSLKSYIKRIRNPRLKVIKHWSREILKGIEYLHNQKPQPIIHRDLKCENIFINSNTSEIRIGDFGLATFIGSSKKLSVIGTPEYIAPEVYEDSYGTPCDIYSFGMCVLEMATAETPYRECHNPMQIYSKISKKIRPASLSSIGNEKLKEFILKCLKDQNERPTSEELLKDPFLNTEDEEDNFPVKIISCPLDLDTIKEERRTGKLQFAKKVYCLNELEASEEKGRKHSLSSSSLISVSDEKKEEDEKDSISEILLSSPDKKKEASDMSKEVNTDGNVKIAEIEKNESLSNGTSKNLESNVKILQKPHDDDYFDFFIKVSDIKYQETLLHFFFIIEFSQETLSIEIEIDKSKISQENIESKVSEILYNNTVTKDSVASIISQVTNISKCIQPVKNHLESLKMLAGSIFYENVFEKKKKGTSSKPRENYSKSVMSLQLKFVECYENYLVSLLIQEAAFSHDYLEAENEEQLNLRYKWEQIQLKNLFLNKLEKIVNKRSNCTAFGMLSDMITPESLLDESLKREEKEMKRKERATSPANSTNSDPLISFFQMHVEGHKNPKNVAKKFTNFSYDLGNSVHNQIGASKQTSSFISESIDFSTHQRISNEDFALKNTDRIPKASLNEKKGMNHPSLPVPLNIRPEEIEDLSKEEFNRKITEAPDEQSKDNECAFENSIGIRTPVYLEEEETKEKKTARFMDLIEFEDANSKKELKNEVSGNEISEHKQESLFRLLKAKSLQPPKPIEEDLISAGKGGSTGNEQMDFPNEFFDLTKEFSKTEAINTVLIPNQKITTPMNSSGTTSGKELKRANSFSNLEGNSIEDNLMKEMVFKIIQECEFVGELRRGMEDMDQSLIRLVQRGLNYLMPSIQVEDNGHYGSFTEKLVKEFQTQNRLEANGIFGTESWEMMKRALKGEFLYLEAIETKGNANLVRMNELERQKQKKLEAQKKESSAALTKLEEKFKIDFSNLN